MNKYIFTNSAILLVSLFALLPSSLLAIHPNQPQGFDPEGSYQQGVDQLDQIDLFNGRLSVTVPIGQFKLIYNSNVWRYQVLDDDGGVPTIRATPDEQNTGGLGWYLGWGEIYAPGHWYNGTDRWIMVGDDGGRHIFYNQLHQGEDDGDTQVLYSRDGSYLRLLLGDDNYTVDVEYPDGTTRRFDSGTGGLGTTYRLSKVWSRFASAEDPDLTVTYNADDTLRTMTDRHGRNHYVRLAEELEGVDLLWIQRVITEVDIEGVGGQRAIYSFDYAHVHVNVSCKDDSGTMPERIRVPHLVAIELPDESVYSMADENGPLYYNLCESGIEDLPGALRGINLPSGGGLRWQFTEYEFPPGEGNSVWNTSAGVARRSLVRADGVEEGAWTYRHTSIGAGGGGADPEIYTEVVPPTGDCTKHYFNGRYWISGSQGWERALPFIYSQEQAGKYLSSQVFEDHDPTTGACAGLPLRSSYLRFRHDQIPGPSQPLRDWYNTNRQLEASRTVYHDDEDRFRDVERSDFDGLGHYREVIETDNFTDPSTTTRVTRIDYSRAQGTYPGTYVPIAPSEPWVLGIYDSVEIEEPNATGEQLTRTEYLHDRQTGFLDCSRQLTSGTDLGPHDIVTTYQPSSDGQLAEVKVFGGDLQSLPVTFDSCDMPTAPVSWLSHTYQYGVLKSSLPRSPSGEPGPYLVYDVDLDPNTGTVLTSRSSTGVAVQFTFDEAGRKVSQISDVGGSATFTYTKASPGQSAKTTTTVSSPAESSEFFKGESVFDDFGRVAKKRRLSQDGTWSEKVIEHNARGWITAVSDWDAPASRMEFLDYDPFGRARTIRPPEGPVHDRISVFTGDRKVVQQTKRALLGGEGWVDRVAERDGQGRLSRVLEGSGPGGAVTPTTYEYDVAGRLRRIVQGAAGGPSQVRSFTYDNRGFLTAETHPEKGPAGGGSVLYRDIDARGLVHRVTDGPHDLAYVFDDLGRVTQVRDRNHGNRLVSELEYDQGQGLGLGQVWRSTQHNYLDLPFNAAGEEDVRVRSIYGYQGPGGQVSSQETQVLWSPGDLSFNQSYEYDQLGQLRTLSYPTCSLATPGCAGSQAATAPQVAHTYNRSQLTGIPGFVDWIAYDSTGNWTEIYHANGVVDHQSMDPVVPGRTGRLFTTGAQPASLNFDSGTFGYDGGDNISSMGNSTFAYDEVGRLVESSQAMVGCPGCLVRQGFSYDRFGNMVSMQSFGEHDYEYSFEVDTSSNRVTSCSSQVSSACPISYDSAGNVTSFAGFQFTYDTRNQLVRQAHLFYLYDAGGERVMSLVNSPTDLVAHFTLRDAEGRLLSKIAYDGSTFSRQRDYIWAGDRLVAATDPDGSVRYHFHLDHTGTPRLLTRPDASVETTQDLLPFGHELPWGSLHDNLKFTGHERDFSTGADYMHARHYMQHLGRFLSVDPVLGDLGNPQRLNRYAYALNDPINSVDPDGQSPYRIAYKAGKKGSRLILGRRVGLDEAIKIARNGGNIMAETRRQAKRVAHEAYQKGYIRHRAEKPGYYSHYQPKKRKKSEPRGHVFFGAPSPNTSNLAGWLAAGGMAGFVVEQVDAGEMSESDAQMLMFLDEWVAPVSTDTSVSAVIKYVELLEKFQKLLKGLFLIDEIDVTAEGQDGNDEPETVPQIREEPDWPTLQEELRAGWSLRSLWDFGCMMNPTTCYRGPGGGIGVHGYYPYKY